MLLCVKYILKFSLLWWIYIVYYFVLNIFLYNSSLNVRDFLHLHEGATHMTLYTIFNVTNAYSGD